LVGLRHQSVAIWTYILSIQPTYIVEFLLTSLSLSQCTNNISRYVTNRNIKKKKQFLNRLNLRRDINKICPFGGWGEDFAPGRMVVPIPTFRDKHSIPFSRARDFKKPVRIYHSTLLQIPEERRFQFFSFILEPLGSEFRL
jgi:hypothetical protein